MTKFKWKKKPSKVLFNIKKKFSSSLFLKKKKKIVLLLGTYNDYKVLDYSKAFFVSLVLKRWDFLSYFLKKKNLKTTSFTVLAIKQLIFANLRFFKYGKLYKFNNNLKKIIYRPNFMLVKGIKLYPKLFIKKKKINKVKKIKTKIIRLLFFFILGLSTSKTHKVTNKYIPKINKKSKIYIFVETLNMCLNILNFYIL